MLGVDPNKVNLLVFPPEHFGGCDYLPSFPAPGLGCDSPNFWRHVPGNISQQLGSFRADDCDSVFVSFVSFIRLQCYLNRNVGTVTGYAAPFRKFSKRALVKRGTGNVKPIGFHLDVIPLSAGAVILNGLESGLSSFFGKFFKTHKTHDSSERESKCMEQGQ